MRDTANAELRVLSGEVSADVDARRKCRRIETLHDTERVELLTGERRDGDADILDVLLPFLRRDDDLIENLSEADCGYQQAG